MEYVPYGASDKVKLSVEIVQKFIAERTKSGATCSDRDAIRFMMMCQAKRLNPFEQDAFLLGYDTQDGPKFSLVTAHQAFLKRAELHPEFDGMDSGTIVRNEDGSLSDMESDFHLPDQTVIGGWATVYCKNRRPTKRRLRRDRFDTGKAQWARDPAGMIVKCAEADALRSTFPTMLGGLYLRQEVSLDVATGVGIEMPGASKLVKVVGQTHRTDGGPQANPDEKAEAAAGLAPEPAGSSTPRETVPPTNTAQRQLADVVESAGFDFATFVRWAQEAGSLANADSYPEWDAIPSADCVRLVRALTGARSRPVVLEQLAKLKAGVA